MGLLHLDLFEIDQRTFALAFRRNNTGSNCRKGSEKLYNVLEKAANFLLLRFKKQKC
jgi:hypothetical protein